MGQKRKEKRLSALDELTSTYGFEEIRMPKILDTGQTHLMRSSNSLVSLAHNHSLHNNNNNNHSNNNYKEDNNSNNIRLQSLSLSAKANNNPSSNNLMGLVDENLHPASTAIIDSNHQCEMVLEDVRPQHVLHNNNHHHHNHHHNNQQHHNNHHHHHQTTTNMTGRTSGSNDDDAAPVTTDPIINSLKQSITTKTIVKNDCEEDIVHISNTNSGSNNNEAALIEQQQKKHQNVCDNRIREYMTTSSGVDNYPHDVSHHNPHHHHHQHTKLNESENANLDEQTKLEKTGVTSTTSKGGTTVPTLHLQKEITLTSTASVLDTTSTTATPLSMAATAATSTPSSTSSTISLSTECSSRLFTSHNAVNNSVLMTGLAQQSITESQQQQTQSQSQQQLIGTPNVTSNNSMGHVETSNSSINIVMKNNNQSHCQDGIMMMVPKGSNIAAIKDVNTMVNVVPGNNAVS